MLLRRPTIPRGLRRTLVASAVLHLMAVAGVAVVTMSSKAARPPVESFIPTKLVRLGTKRPEKLLPKVEAQPAPAPKPEVSLSKPVTESAPKTEAKPQPAQPSALDRAKSLASVNSALDRLKRTSTVDDGVGDPSGSANGEVTDLSKAIVGNKFVTEIYSCMKDNWELEGVGKDQVGGREATIVVRIQPDGRLTGAELLEESGLPAFDQAVERAIARCRKVSEPPEHLRETFGNEGIEIVFRP